MPVIPKTGVLEFGGRRYMMFGYPKTGTCFMYRSDVFVNLGVWRVKNRKW